MSEASTVNAIHQPPIPDTRGESSSRSIAQPSTPVQLASGATSRRPSAPLHEESLSERIAMEAEAMARHALAVGLLVPPSLLSGLSLLSAATAGPHPRIEDASSVSRSERVHRLAQIHQHLVRIVAPARPESLLLMARENQRSRWLAILGPVPLIRQMMLAALAFLAALIALSLLESVNANNISQGFFRGHGSQQLACQAFLLSAAGLGACFSVLFDATKYVGRGSFDPKYDASYWSRLVLGLMAGVMMAELLGPDVSQRGGDAVLASDYFARPTLAMLGGFSASVVHRLLQRVVGTLESLVTAGPDDVAISRERALTSEVRAEQSQRQARLAARVTHALNDMGDELSVRVRGELDRLIQDLIGPEDYEERRS